MKNFKLLFSARSVTLIPADIDLIIVALILLKKTQALFLCAMHRAYKDVLYQYFCH